MTTSTSRRFRRRSPAHEAVNPNKENKQEQTFFGDSFSEPFFKPVTPVANSEVVQRKCTDCEKKEKKVQRAPDKREEEENKVLKKKEKKEEERLQQAPEKKEEEKLMKKEDKKEEEKVQTKGTVTSPSNSPAVAPAYIHSISGKGQSMDSNARSFFESKMDNDFSTVKIHTGKEAANSAKEVNAQAYTYGNNIVFNEGKYNTDTSEGKHLLAHELTHVLQQTGQLQRKEIAEERNSKPTFALEEKPEEKKVLTPVFTSGIGTSLKNKIAYANCSGINVGGDTVANYDHGSYSANSTSVKRAKNCTECVGDECLTLAGNITSVFHANPQVTLPVVPSGLNECEHNAVQIFINTTLSQHEQQHVAAFNKYNGTIITPFNYTGCREEFDAYIKTIHDNIDDVRITSANAISDALDPFSPTIPCNCPDTEPQTDTGADTK